MKLTPVFRAFLFGLSVASAAWAQVPVTMTALTSFSGDGWIQPPGPNGEPGELSWLSGTTTTERSLDYSPVTNHLYVSSRNGGIFVRILDPLTGEELPGPTGSGLDMTGVGGGFFLISAVTVGADGAIYGCNLALTSATGFKIYQWADENSLPTVAFDSSVSGPITTARIGDTLDAIGSGASTLLVAGESASAGGGATPKNGYAIFSTADGILFDGTLITFSGAEPAVGDFAVGLTFTDADSVIGSKGTGGFKFTTYDRPSGTGTFEQAKVLLPITQRPMDFAVVNGVPVLATIETNGNTTTPAATFSTVRVYDLTDPSATPLPLLASGRTATYWNTQTSSAGGTGSVTWGNNFGTTANLYALCTNNGIQAFTVTVGTLPFVVTALSRDAGANTLTITWNSTTGGTYRVESSTDLQTWSPVISGVPAAGDTTSYVWNVTPAASSAAFLRVAREQSVIQ